MRKVRYTYSGVYYVMIYADAVPDSPAEFTVAASLLDFSIRDVSPDYGGNVGNVTSRIFGAQLTHDTVVTLENADGNVVDGIAILVDPGELFVTFDLEGAVAGVYDVVARDTVLGSSILPGSFSVTEGGDSEFWATANPPNAVFERRESVIWLNYGNRGKTDVIAPVFQITLPDGESAGTSGSGWRAEKRLTIAGVVPNVPIGVIPPGAEYQIPIHFRAPDMIGDYVVKVDVLDPSDPTLRAEDVKWDVVEEAVKPPGIDESVWNADWAAMTSEAGSTYGEYLDNYTAYAINTLKHADVHPSAGEYLLGITSYADWLRSPGACADGDNRGLETPVARHDEPQFIQTTRWGTWSLSLYPYKSPPEFERPVRVSANSPWEPRFEPAVDDDPQWDISPYEGDFLPPGRLHLPDYQVNYDPAVGAGALFELEYIYTPPWAVPANPPDIEDFRWTEIAWTNDWERNFGAYRPYTFPVPPYKVTEQRGNPYYYNISERDGFMEEGPDPLILRYTFLFRSAPWRSWDYLLLNGFTDFVWEAEVHLALDPAHEVDFDPGILDGYVWGWHVKQIDEGDNPQPPVPGPPFYPIPKITISIVRSYDPNEKVGPGGAIPGANFVDAGTTFPYTVYFENDPELANAPAQQVRITDAIDEDLDLSTFQFTEVAFADHVISVPSGTSYYQTTVDLRPEGIAAIVDVELSLDAQSREVVALFKAIDPQTGVLPEDPLVGLLYPNDDTGRGEGHVSYLVRPKSGLSSGTEITNKASIIFDYNDPIETPLVLNTIDAGTPTSHVLPLPATTTEAEFLVEWTGQDEPNGSGIADYDVYYRVDEDPYVLWLDDTTDTSAMFTGELGRTYEFYSIASDNVGHTETAPNVADASITVGLPLELEAGSDQTALEGDLVDLPEAWYTFGGDPGILSLVINWGDGTIEPGTLVHGTGGGTIADTHTYADNGEYPITLAISHGTEDPVGDSLAVTVSNVAPTATLSNNGPVDEGFAATVSFANPYDPSTADTTVGFLHSYDFDNDGTFEVSASPLASMTVPASFFADGPGSRTVLARTEDKDGGYTDYTTDIAINNVAPTANAGGSYTAEENVPVTLSGSATDPGTLDTLAYEWDLSYDGLVFAVDVSGQSVLNTWTDDFTGNVALRVTDKDGASHIDLAAVTVTNVNPVANAGADQPVNEGDTVDFAATATDQSPDDQLILAYTWDFGDSNDPTPGSGATPSHLYADNGVYTVTLTVTDDDGGVATDTLTVTVNNVAPVVDPIGGPTVAVRGQLLEFTGSFTDPGMQDTHTLQWVVTRSNILGPGIDMCDDYGKPQVLLMRYTGDGEDATMTSQDDEKVSVVGDPNDAPTVRIIVSDKDDPGHADARIYFDGVLEIDQTFEIDATMAGDSKLKAKTFVYIMDLSGLILQTIEFHTSCSQPLVLGDRFGGVQLVGFAGEHGPGGTLDASGDEIVATGSGLGFSFTPTLLGTYTVNFTATDDDGGVGTASSDVAVDLIVVTQDPLDPTQTVLFVGGSMGRDKIDLKDGHEPDMIEVKIHEKSNKFKLRHSQSFLGQQSKRGCAPIWVHTPFHTTKVDTTSHERIHPLPTVYQREVEGA